MKKRIILISLALLLALAVGVPTWLFFSRYSQTQETQPVVNALAEEGALRSAIAAAGTLTAQESETLTVPGGVQLARFCVEAGDTVAAGDVLAVADPISVAQRMSALQEMIDELDEELEDARQETGATTVSAAAAGRVKALSAAVGESVASVMNRDGALLRLSLDGKMSVEINGGTLTVGENVNVLREDGSALTGTVESCVNGKSTVTVTDDGPRFGESVTVQDNAGNALGGGALSIHSELKVTGYIGAIKAVYAVENRKVSAGTILLTLTDTQELAEYTKLLAERDELAEQMAQLAALRADGNIRAQFSGVVAQINEDILADDAASPLAARGDAAQIVRLASATDWSDAAHYANSVALATGVANNTISYLTLEGVAASGVGTLDLSAATLGTAGSLIYSDNVSAWYNGVELGSFGAVQAGRVLVISTGFNGATDISVFLTDTVGYRVACDAGMSCTPSVAAAGADFTAALTGVTGELSVMVGGTPLTDFHYANGALTIAAAQITGDITLSQTSPPAEDDDPETPEDPGGGSGHSGGFGAITGGLGGFAAAAQTQETPTDFSAVENGILVLTPNETMTVSIAVDELDISSLAVGQSVEITLDALTGQIFTGTVTKIATTGSNSGGSSKYVAEITLPRTAEMLPGMNASVTITLGTLENALLLPVEALQEEGNRVFVYRAYDEKTDTLYDEQDVETGVSDGSLTQIIEGLAPGERVYYRYSSEAEPLSFGQ